MKKIINRLTYDTATATVCGVFCNGLSVSDFGHLTETLYQTKKGRFFLYGNGGASTWCADRVGNTWSGGEKIRALTDAEAAKWVEDRQINPDDLIGILEFEAA